MTKILFLLFIVCSVINITILILIYLFREEIWYYTRLKMGLIGKLIKVVETITPEFYSTLKEGDKVYEKRTSTYFQYHNGALIKIDSLMNLN